MKTISLVACNRPMLAVKALSSIALALASYEEHTYDKLIVSIDPFGCGLIDQKVLMVCEETLGVITEAGLIDCELYTNVKQLGPGGNHVVSLQRAFEEHGSDFNVQVEDDALLMVDALKLADYFHDVHCGINSRYTLMSMCNHRAFGRGDNPGNVPDLPEFLVESVYITSPFAWALGKHQWPFVKATWDRKETEPNGWDWSLSYYMNKTKRVALHPVLSRCANVGQVGTNETVESFEQTQKGLLYSDGSEHGEFFVAGRIPFEELGQQADWVIKEDRRMFPR